VSTCQRVKVSKFQRVKVSKFQRVKVSKFQLVKVSKFQQFIKVSKFVRLLAFRRPTGSTCRTFQRVKVSTLVRLLAFRRPTGSTCKSVNVSTFRRLSDSWPLGGRLGKSANVLTFQSLSDSWPLGGRRGFDVSTFKRSNRRVSIPNFTIDPRNMSYIAIIIEPRLSHVHPALIAIRSVRATLPTWQIRWICGKANVGAATAALRAMPELGVELVQLDEEEEPMTRSTYSTHLTSPDFWQPLVEFNKVLLFQSDSALSPHSSCTISDFFGYDYVGAPWTHDPLGKELPGVLEKYRQVGNGGLSLRCPRAMLRAIDLLATEESRHPEDLVLCRAMHRANATNMTNGQKADMFKLPSVDVACNFSVEMRPLASRSSKGPLGIHSPWLYLDESDLLQLTQQSSFFKEMIAWHHDSQLQHCLSLDRAAMDKLWAVGTSLTNPLSFSFPPTKIPAPILKTRLLSPLNPYDRSTYVYDSESDYMRQYQESWFAISPPKAGHDCFRHLEVMACRCIPLIGLDDCPDTIMAHYPKHVLQHVFHTIQRLCKEQFDTTDIRILLDPLKAQEFVVSPILLQKWSSVLHDWLLEHLTCDKMASWIMSRMGLQANGPKGPRPKVLMIDTTLEGREDQKDDYTASMTYIGFKLLLGLDATSTHDSPLVYDDVVSSVDPATGAVCAGPSINKQVVVYGKGFNWLGVLPTTLRDVRLSEEQIRANIASRHYDLIVYLSVRHEFYLRDCIHQHYPKERVAYIDGRDKVTDFKASGHETWFIRPLVPHSMKLHIERLQPLDIVKKRIALCVCGSKIELCLLSLPSILARIPYPTTVFLAGHVSDGFASSLSSVLFNNSNMALCNVSVYDDYMREIDRQLTPAGLPQSVDVESCVPALRNMNMCAHMVECYEDSAGAFDCVIKVRPDVLANSNWSFELPLDKQSIYTTTPPFMPHSTSVNHHKGLIYWYGDPGINDQVFYGTSKAMAKLMSTSQHLHLIYKKQRNLEEILFSSSKFHGLTVKPSSLVTYKFAQ